MQLAVFDLDHTLLQADSDHGWNAFLVDIGVVTDAEFAESNERWYREYTNGIRILSNTTAGHSGCMVSTGLNR